MLRMSWEQKNHRPSGDRPSWDFLQITSAKPAPASPPPPAKEESDPRYCKKEPYKYGRLPSGSMRIMKLDPGTWSDGFSCTLVETPVSRPIKYTALSYVWGSSEKTRCVRVDGFCLPITENLFIALFHLRHKQQPVFLWIDSVCIDQNNTEEKSTQVANMASVYSHAKRVLVWLGPNLTTSAVSGEVHPAGDSIPEWRHYNEFLGRIWTPLAFASTIFRFLTHRGPFIKDKTERCRVWSAILKQPY